MFALNVKSDKIRETSVDDVHYETGLGLAEIAREGAERFAKRYHPDKYEKFLQENESAAYPLILDVENLLTKLEELARDDVLLGVIKRRDLVSGQDKAFLADFVFIHWLRSHAIMSFMIEAKKKHGITKFEHLVTLKWALEDAGFSYPIVSHIASAHWNLYRTEEDIFPLTDSPILVQPRTKTIMLALSPRLLLEIYLGLLTNVEEWRTEDSIDHEKLTEFRRCTIGNTFREIVFSDRRVLERWQRTPEFQQRVNAIKTKGYHALIAEEKRREVWLMHTLGNR